MKAGWSPRRLPNCVSRPYWALCDKVNLEKKSPYVGPHQLCRTKYGRRVRASSGKGRASMRSEKGSRAGDQLDLGPGPAAAGLGLVVLAQPAELPGLQERRPNDPLLRQ